MTIEQHITVTQQLPQPELVNRSAPKTAPEVAVGNTVNAQSTERPGDPVSKSAISTQEVHQLVDNFSELAKRIDRGLEFRIDEITGKTVVTVMDRESEEIIRQIPSEELLVLAQRLKEGGGLIDELTG